MEPAFGPSCNGTQSKTFGVRRTTELESQLGNVMVIERLGRSCVVLQGRCCVMLCCRAGVVLCCVAGQVLC